MFSVVIPLYNKEKYILRTVESVLSQSFADFELIIVDDGSVDNSLDVIKNILDPRIKIIQQANQGEGPARNKGMAEARYDWIALLDADDAWSINHLNELDKIIHSAPSLGMVSTRHLKLNTNLNPPPTSEDKPSNIRLIDYFLEASKDISIVCSSSVAISKKAFDHIGGFGNAKMGADLEYWARVALSYPVAISDKTTCYYFRGTGGITESETVAKKEYKYLTSLKDLSPSLEMLIKQSIKNPAILKKNNIKAYINSRVYNAVVGATFREDFAIGKNYAKLATPRLEARYMFLKLYQITPTIILKTTKARYDKHKKR